MRGILIILVSMFVLTSTAICQPSADESSTNLSDQPSDKMDWWREARFGMFIHWGLYAVPAGEHEGERTKGIGEWIMHHLHIPINEYERYAQQFDPVKFNAEEWVSIAKDAGMKYIVITSKHHDGFCLWDSQVTDWDIMDATPFKRDILKELADACEKEGIRLCFYHSIMDWHHPDAQAINEPNYNSRDPKSVNPNFERYYEDYLKPQVTELMTGYGDIGVMWFDGEWIPDYTTEMGKDLYKVITDADPDMIVNNRVDKGRQGMQGMNKVGEFAGDFGTPEQEIPDQGLPNVDWESCMTMNDTWGYKHFDQNWKSAETLIRNLIDIASKGGNYLLNVGPTGEGEVPDASVQRLKKIGKWMKVNGKSIYGTSASPYEKPTWGRYTQKGADLYVHIFDWPESQQLIIPDLESQFRQASILTEGMERKLELKRTAQGWTVKLPTSAPDQIATVVVLRK